MFILRGLRLRLRRCAFRRSYALKIVQKATRFALALRRGVEFAVEKIERAIQQIGVIGPGECAGRGCACGDCGVGAISGSSCRLNRSMQHHLV